jgi:hypothetical protein
LQFNFFFRTHKEPIKRQEKKKARKKEREKRKKERDKSRRGKHERKKQIDKEEKLQERFIFHVQPILFYLFNFEHESIRIYI